MSNRERVNLSEHALLVSLNISQWTARKLDRSETQAVAAKHGLQGDVARVNKDLLPMAHSLDVVHKLTGKIRTDYYRCSLPWADGTQIIKATSYMEFARMMATWRSKWEDAARKFVSDYPQLREDARHLLNTLYKDEDYPSPEHVASKFKFDVAFFPVPAAGDCQRIKAISEFATDIADDIVERTLARQNEAMDAAWQRIYDVVCKAHERLSDPDNIFRDSLIENARELCTVLPSLNLTDDPKLEGMRKMVEKALCNVEAEDLRKDTALRADVSSKLASIMDKMGTLYG